MCPRSGTAIEQLLSDTGERTRLGNEANDVARGRFSKTASAVGLVAAYRTALSG